MKNGVYFLLIAFFVTINVNAQNGLDYFPSNVGYKWNYKVFPLDSLENPIEELATARVDSFAGTADAHGLFAHILLSKSGGINTINFQPYTDTTFLHFSGNTVHNYFSVIGTLETSDVIDSLIAQIDSSLIDVIYFLQSLEDYYPLYDVTGNINQSYTLFSKDTTVTIDSVSIPVRFSIKTKRLNDESINTIFGLQYCKKFELSASISLIIQLFPPPFPPQVIDIITFPLIKWIAPNKWLIKEYMPNINVTEVPIYEIPAFTIPGYIAELTDSFVGVEDDTEILPVGFTLSQNYPNPFNPETNITFSIDKTSNIKLTIFNSLGEEIITLIDKEMNPGKYNVTFNGSSFNNLSSGVYYYSLKTNFGSITKKMSLIK